MITHHAGRRPHYTVAVGDEARVVTYDATLGFEAQREAWQHAIELEAELEELELEQRAAVLDSQAALAERYPRYVQRGADVVDTATGRWYCTAAAWPHSPPARDGAHLGRA